MRSIAGRLAAVALAGLFVLIWRAHIDRDVVVALFGLYFLLLSAAEAEQIEMKLNGGVTEMIKATGVQFSSRPPAPASDWHTGPMRQYVITLSGRAELEMADGQKVAVGPGQINLIEDTTGKGHITRNLEDRVVVTIPLADQTADNLSHK